MPKYLFIYRAGQDFAPPKNGGDHMQNWRAWSQGLGAAMVYPGMPCSTANIVGPKGVTPGSGEPGVAGISVVEAADMEAAMAIAQECPHLDLNGDIVVAEGMDMEM